MIYKLLLKASIWAASKIHKEEVVQVDIWFDGGRRVMVMSRDEQDKLVYMARHLNTNWSDQEKEELKTAIRKIRREELNG